MGDVYTRTRVAELRSQLPRERLLEIEGQLERQKKGAGLVAGLAAIGLLGIAGIHRFVLGQIGIGIAQLVTVGGLGIWTIIDMVRAKKLADDYNTELELKLVEQALRAHQLRAPGT